MISCFFIIIIIIIIINISIVIFIIIGSNGPQKFCIEKVGKETWLPRSHTWYVDSWTADLISRLETYF